MTFVYAEQYPEHDRTSCSDDDVCNFTADGTGCRRCNALMFDRLEKLEKEAKVDQFARGVIAALGVLTAHGEKHGATIHDEIVQSVGEKAIYAAAEPEDYEWAGLNPRKKPRGKRREAEK